MDRTLTKFVAALRNADLAVSPAETLEAATALDLIGLTDRDLLRDSLSIILAKSPEEKAAFDTCFARFFSAHRADDAELQQFKESWAALAEQDESPGQDEAGDSPMSSGGEFTDEPAKRQRKNTKRRRSPTGDLSRLAQILLSGDPAEISMLLKAASKAVHLDAIKTLRERKLIERRMLLHMGIEQLNEEIAGLERQHGKSREQAQLLSYARQYLEEQVRQYVEQQYLLLVDASGKQFLVDAVADTHLANIQPHYFDQLNEVVRKLASQLARRHAKRQKHVNRGQLDIRRTMRRNVAYDGAMYDLRWRLIKREKPRVFVLCDVSGSVRTVSRFLLTFLYSLTEVIGEVRAFAFSSHLGEVTDYFRENSLKDAIEMSLDDYGKGSTDYGKALRTFYRDYKRDLDFKSTVLILGDGRNNYFDANVDVLKDIRRSAKQLVWLNPEPRSEWRTGDSVMSEYAPVCHFVGECNSLKDLERMVSRTLKSAS